MRSSERFHFVTFGILSLVNCLLIIFCLVNRPPKVDLKNAKGLSNGNLQNLHVELAKLAAERCGEVG